MSFVLKREAKVKNKDLTPFCLILMPHKPFYFLTHEGRPHIFSGYRIPILEGKKSQLIGMLMVEWTLEFLPTKQIGTNLVGCGQNRREISRTEVISLT